MNKSRFLNTAAMFFGPEGSGASGGGDGGGDAGAGEGGDKGGEGGDKSPESILFGDDGKGGKPPAGEKKEGESGEGAADWKEYVPDPKKSDEENATAKAEHDKKKPAEGKDKKPDPLDTVPDDGKYALTMPEGVKVDQEMLDALGPKFKAKNLTTREAQELADEFIKVQTEREKKRGEAWGQTLQKWVDDAKADKDIGGDKWDGTVKDARRAVDAYGTPALKEYLEASGGGNHPELIRFMSKVGRTIREDNPAGGGDGGSKPAEAAHILFPNDAPKGK